MYRQLLRWMRAFARRIKDDPYPLSRLVPLLLQRGIQQGVIMDVDAKDIQKWRSVPSLIIHQGGAVTQTTAESLVDGAPCLAADGSSAIGNEFANCAAVSLPRHVLSTFQNTEHAIGLS